MGAHALEDLARIFKPRGLNSLDAISNYDIACFMKAKYAKTLGLIFRRPVSGNVRWADVEGLLSALGAEMVEAAKRTGKILTIAYQNRF